LGASMDVMAHCGRGVHVLTRSVSKYPTRPDVLEMEITKVDLSCLQ